MAVALLFVETSLRRNPERVHKNPLRPCPEAHTSACIFRPPSVYLIHERAHWEDPASLGSKRRNTMHVFALCIVQLCLPSVVACSLLVSQLLLHLSIFQAIVGRSSPTPLQLCPIFHTTVVSWNNIDGREETFVTDVGRRRCATSIAGTCGFVPCGRAQVRR